MSALDAQCLEARDQLAAWISEHYEGSRDAAKAELAEHGFDEDFNGWVIPLDGLPSILFAVDQHFPFRRPFTAVIGGDHGLRDLPHVENNGRLCTFGDHVSLNHLDPTGVAKAYIQQSRKLLVEVMNGEHSNDFEEDFEAYWRRNPKDLLAIRTLVDWREESRWILFRRGKNQMVVSDETDRLDRWSAHVDPTLATAPDQPAVYLWLNSLPHPQDYPTDLPSLLQFVAERCPQGVQLVDDLLDLTHEPLAIVFCGQSEQGRLGRGSFLIFPRKISLPGFRPGKVPKKLAQKFRRVYRASVFPLDVARTRMNQETSKALSDKTVAVIGCGSVGSGVARLLAQSGVGSLVLFDPENLELENIGRHDLGANDAGKNKAEAMALRISERLPDCNVTSIGNDWREVDFAASPLANCDLIVSTTADWGSDVALVETKPEAPLLFGWLERHAAASHALLLREPNDYLLGFDKEGRPLREATVYQKEEDTSVCGGATSVYGAVDLSKAQSLIAGLAIDTLSGDLQTPLWRVETCSPDLLEELGGDWSDWLRDEAGVPVAGGQTFGLKWPESNDG